MGGSLLRSGGVRTGGNGRSIGRRANRRTAGGSRYGSRSFSWARLVSAPVRLVEGFEDGAAYLGRGGCPSQIRSLRASRRQDPRRGASDSLGGTRRVQVVEHHRR